MVTNASRPLSSYSPVKPHHCFVLDLPSICIKPRPRDDKIYTGDLSFTYPMNTNNLPQGVYQFQSQHIFTIPGGLVVRIQRSQ